MTIADLVLLARRLSRTDSTSYTDAQLLLDLNNSYERVVAKLLAETAGSDMPFGDLNYESFPTFALTMSNGVQAYDINDWQVTTTQQTLATSTPLAILGVEVLDNTGIWHPLVRTSFREIRESGIAHPEYYKTNGQPKEYEIRDSQIVLYPAPDNGVTVTLASGLRLYYLRSAEVFSSLTEDSSAKEPGFPRGYHDILAWESAYTYAISISPPLPNAGALLQGVQFRERELLKFISKRDQDTRPIMSGRGINYI